MHNPILNQDLRDLKSDGDMTELRGKDRRFLRAQGNRLPIHVQVGHNGFDEKTISSITTFLNDHELIKLKLHKKLSSQRKQIATALSELSQSELVQVFGNAILLYKAKATPGIIFPE